MATELTVLVLVALLQVGQLLLASTYKNRQLGNEFNVSARDGEPPALTGMAGRSDRALRNHYESIPLFAIAVLVIALADKSTGLTAGLAWAYLAARVLYVPAYLLAWSPWRSAIWGIGFLATMILLVIALI